MSPASRDPTRANRYRTWSCSLTERLKLFALGFLLGLLRAALDADGPVATARAATYESTCAERRWPQRTCDAEGSLNRVAPGRDDRPVTPARSGHRGRPALRP